MNTHRIMREAELTAKRIARINAFLSDVPDGHIERHVKDEKAYYLICSVKDKRRYRKYISSGDNDTLTKYLKKQFYTKLLPVLERNLKALQYLLKHYEPDPDKSVLSSMPDWAADKIRSDSGSYRDKYIENWSNSPFVSNPYHAADRKIQTLHGDMVRSKTEREIADALYRRGLVYRPDCEVKLNDGTIYADFVILHPVTLKEYYWEHSGMLGDPSYTQANYDRLSRYANSGILVGERLIVTGENRDYVISSQAIERIIDTFFGE